MHPQVTSLAISYIWNKEENEMRRVKKDFKEVRIDVSIYTVKFAGFTQKNLSGVNLLYLRLNCYKCIYCFHDHKK